VPLAETPIDAELTTPTGAAILAALVEQFGQLPPMTIDTIGYGAGTRDLEQQANLLRLFVGEAEGDGQGEQVWTVETNLDDISGELVGYCTSRLWESGALDVYTTAIQMKKNRPGVTLTVLCRAEDVGRIESVLFSETSTLGVRRWPVSRRKLHRQAHRVATPWGEIEGKVAFVPGQAPVFAPEYESCIRAARDGRVALRAVYEAAVKAFDPQSVEQR
jgi:uncharacterized protein (DUF111 family)